MKLPEAIQRQIEEAEALERELYGQAEPVNDQQEPAQEVTEVQDEPVAQASEVVEPESKPVEQSEPPAHRDDEAGYWKQRFATVQGILQSQSAQFTEQLRSANDRIQALANELEAQRTTAAAATTQPKATDNDAEVFGEDLVEAMDRRAALRAREMVAQEAKPLLDYIKQLEARLGTVDQQVAVSAQDRFRSNLSRLVPDYEAVNADAGFLGWLGEVDPVYGLPRQAALDSAAGANDAERVAAIFNAYKLLTGKQANQQQRQQVRQELERQTAPTSTRGANQPAPAGKVWSLAEYEAALDPRNIQKLGRQKADALYEDAERALAEGRVQA